MKNTFSLVSTYTYKPVLPKSANFQNKENQVFLHSLCSPPTGTTALLQAVQIKLLSLRNEVVIIIGWPPLHSDRRYQRGGLHPRGEVQCVLQ